MQLNLLGKNKPHKPKLFWEKNNQENSNSNNGKLTHARLKKLYKVSLILIPLYEYKSLRLYINTPTLCL